MSMAASVLAQTGSCGWLDTVVLVKHKGLSLLGPGVDRRSGRMRLGSPRSTFCRGVICGGLSGARLEETWAANSDGENSKKKNWTREKGSFRELEAPENREMVKRE